MLLSIASLNSDINAEFVNKSLFSLDISDKNESYAALDVAAASAETPEGLVLLAACLVFGEK